MSTEKVLRLLDPTQQLKLHPSLPDVVEYRKSGLSLNHVIGCPLDCAYCVRHLFDNYEMKIPHALMSDQQAVETLIHHKYFQPHLTPVQIFNRATDPMLKNVKPHTFRVLRDLDNRGLTNNVLVITRWKVSPADCEFFNSLTNLRLTILVTHSGISDHRIEPVRSEVAKSSLRTLYENSRSYRVVLYWRPIVPGLNDSDEDLNVAVELSKQAHATVFTGLFYRDEISAFFRDSGIPEPYQSTARRKIFPENLERRVLTAFRNGEIHTALFRKTSCAISYAHGNSDYNGHYGIRELCDICPSGQIQKCQAAWHKPTAEAVTAKALHLDAVITPEITDRSIIVENLDEAPRYYLQHHFAYQVHDRNKPHNFGRHGRAEIGWQDAPSTVTPPLAPR